MNSIQIELDENWIQLLNNQIGTILAPTMPDDKYEREPQAINGVQIRIGANIETNTIIMPQEALVFNVVSSVWARATYSNPFIGVVR